jgi:hypothetical protein
MSVARGQAIGILTVIAVSVGCAAPEAGKTAALEARVAALEAHQAVPASPLSASAPAYVPGLGEIMGFNQIRHDKLWFAGQAANWPLAAYELDELKEGLDAAVTYHPTDEKVPAPLTVLVPRFTGPPLAELQRAIAIKDRQAFVKAFDDLTAGCNGCHVAAKFGFNVVKRPTAPPFTNQEFGVK